MRGPQDRRVNGEIQGHRRCGIGHLGFHVHLELEQRDALLRGCPFGRGLCRARLDEVADLHQVGEEGRVGAYLDLPGEHLGIDEAPLGAPEGTCPGLRAGLHEPFRRQDLDRFADDRAADAELDGEVSLGRERRARSQLAPDDAEAQVAHDDAVQAATISEAGLQGNGHTIRR